MDGTHDILCCSKNNTSKTPFSKGKTYSKSKPRFPNFKLTQSHRTHLQPSFQVHLPWADCPADNGTAQLECSKASATAYFWYREALDASPSIEEPGAPRWWIVICLLLAWIIVFFIVMKGIQSSGKVGEILWQL